MSAADDARKRLRAAAHAFHGSAERAKRVLIGGDPNAIQETAKALRSREAELYAAAEALTLIELQPIVSAPAMVQIIASNATKPAGRCPMSPGWLHQLVVRDTGLVKNDAPVLRVECGVCHAPAVEGGDNG